MREELLDQVAAPIRDAAATCFTPDGTEKNGI